ncbi:hypothetical protein V6Z11_D06G145700 [Gossypium hirsutum]
MLEKALPNAMLKARPNIESRVRLLKRDWSIVYDMLNGQNNSSFGWDDHRVIEKSVSSDIVVSLTTTNLLPYTQKIERLEKTLKQPLTFLKK